MPNNPVRQLAKMKAALPNGYSINEERSLKNDDVWASFDAGLSPPLVWRNGKWKSTAF